MPAILVLVLIFIILLILVSCIRIVPQAQAMVVERLGAYLETWNVGIHFKVPFIDRVAERSSGQILDRHDRVLNAVCVELRVRDLEEHDRIDLHGYVILCDHRLRCKVNDLLF